MSNAAVMKFVRYFRKIQFIVKEQLFDLLDLVDNNVLLNGGSFYLGEDVRKVGVVISQLLGNQVGVVRVWYLVGIVNHLGDHILDLLDDYAALVFHQFQPGIKKALP